MLDALTARPVAKATAAQLATCDSPVLAEIVSAALRTDPPHSGWFLGGIIDRLPMTLLDDLAAQPVRYRNSGPNGAADDVIAGVSVQHPAALTAHRSSARVVGPRAQPECLLCGVAMASRR